MKIIHKISTFRKVSPFLWFLLIGCFLWVFPIEIRMMSFSFDSSSGYSWHLAGWGILGIGMIYLLGCIPTLFCYLFRFINRRLAWVILLILWILSMYHAILAITPKSFYQKTLGQELAQIAVIEKFQFYDSFCDGHFATGYFSGNEKEIIRYLNDNFDIKQSSNYYSINDRSCVSLTEDGDYKLLTYWTSGDLYICRDGRYFVFRRRSA